MVGSKAMWATLKGTVLVVLSFTELSAQSAPTVIPNNFETYDLFEFDLESKWNVLPASGSLSIHQATENVEMFEYPSGTETSRDWWMVRLTNASDVQRFGLRFEKGIKDDLVIVKLVNDKISEVDTLGLYTVHQKTDVMQRLRVSAIEIGKQSSITILLAGWTGKGSPKATLSQLSDFEDYSYAYTRMSLIFTVIFAIILIYQLGTLILIRSRSYLYYSLLAFGYLLHAFNSQLDGTTTIAFTDDLSILSATTICIGGLLLWRRFLQINNGIWYRVYQVLIVASISVVTLVLTYMTVPNVLPRLNAFATNLAAFIALCVLTCWISSSIIFSYKGKQNAKYYLLTNIPILFGGLVFLGVWFAVEHLWTANTGMVNIVVNYVFYGSGVLQLLLFALVIGLALKKKMIGSYQSERKQKQLLEDRVQERTDELLKINEQLTNKNEELKKINGTKNRLLAILSHDFRAPINNVASLMSLLKEHRFSPEEFSSLIPELEKSIAETTSFMSLLIHWTQSQNEGIVPKKSVFTAKSLIIRSTEHLKSALESKELSLTTMPNDISICADRNMLDLVLRNLLSNAIKFSYPKGKIEIECSGVDGGLVEVHVIDHGVGIAKSRIKGFFDVSQKNTTAGTRGEKGFGMGLILCKDFVELNGGRLTFVSEKGRGSTFSILIPSGEMTTVSSASET